jgi:cell division GTPase FtsZ
MNSKRRSILNALAIALAGPATCMATATEQRAVNLVGFGGAGTRMVELFTVRHPNCVERDYIGVVDRERVGATEQVTLNVISAGSEPNAGPLIVVAGLGREGGELSYEFTRMWVESRRVEVRALFAYPLIFEGNRRTRGLEQAARFVRTFGSADALDNESVFLVDGDSLFDLYRRANAMAMPKLSRLVAA